jgi:hypothetical protein
MLEKGKNVHCLTEDQKHVLMCAAENLRVAGRTEATVDAAFRLAAKLDAMRADALMPGEYFATLLGREWVGPDGINYKPQCRREPAEF